MALVRYLSCVRYVYVNAVQQAPTSVPHPAFRFESQMLAVNFVSPGG